MKPIAHDVLDLPGPLRQLAKSVPLLHKTLQQVIFPTLRREVSAASDDVIQLSVVMAQYGALRLSGWSEHPVLSTSSA